MLFLGPPGTGKTTAAEKFAIMMYQLGVLPTKKFHYVTASNLIDRYVGGSGNNMKEALERAKGGILFIDEAYGMLPPGRGRGGHSFGGDLMQTLLGITNYIIITISITIIIIIIIIIIY